MSGEWFDNKIIISLQESEETLSVAGTGKGTTSSTQAARIASEVDRFNGKMKQLGSPLRIEMAGITGDKLRSDYLGKTEYALNANFQYNPVPYLGNKDIGSVSVTPANVDRFIGALSEINATADRYLTDLRAGREVNVASIESSVTQTLKKALPGTKTANLEPLNYSLSFVPSREAPTRDGLKPREDATRDIRQLGAAAIKLADILPGVQTNVSEPRKYNIAYVSNGLDAEGNDDNSRNGRIIGYDDDGRGPPKGAGYREVVNQAGGPTKSYQKFLGQLATLQEDYAGQEEKNIVLKASDGRVVFSLKANAENVARISAALNAANVVQLQMRNASAQTEIEVPRLQKAAEQAIKSSLGIK